MTIRPLNGGLRFIETQPRQFTNLQLRSQTLRRLFGLDPQPTEWEQEGGRPIYDRLPRASEQYRRDPEDNGYGKVFIDETQRLAVGPGSLKAELTEGSNLLINSGKVSWPEGVTSHSETTINIEILGLESSTWYVGYELITDNSDKNFIYQLVDQSIENFDGWSVSSPSPVCNFEAPYAMFSSGDNYFIPNSGQLILDLTVQNQFTKITIPVQGITSANGASLTTDLSTGKYLPYYDTINSALVWDNLNFSDSPTQIIFELPNTITRISGITFSGIFEIINRGESLLQDTDLVIYNSRDPELQTSLLALLGYFETDLNGLISNLRDIRQITNIKNEPVAKWLTQAQDDDLIYYYNQIKNYAELWMNPNNAGNSIYDKELI